MPTSACLPLGASGPVSAMEKPILMGSWARVGAAKRAAVRAATANSLAAAPADARRHNRFGISSPPGFQRFGGTLRGSRRRSQEALSVAAPHRFWEAAHFASAVGAKGPSPRPLQGTSLRNPPRRGHFGRSNFRTQELLQTEVLHFAHCVAGQAVDEHDVA